VTNTITLNPLTAAIVASFLLGEPIGLPLILGIVAVFAGILIASADRPAPPASRHDLAGGLRPIARVGQWFAHQRERRASRDRLQAMSDAELRDIGVRREDITGAVDGLKRPDLEDWMAR
jgi:uncharacterized protein YjiS (DUF1127 family)